MQAGNHPVKVERIGTVKLISEIGGELVERHRLFADHENRLFAADSHPVADQP